MDCAIWLPAIFFLGFMAMILSLAERGKRNAAGCSKKLGEEERREMCIRLVALESLTVTPSQYAGKRVDWLWSCQTLGRAPQSFASSVMVGLRLPCGQQDAESSTCSQQGQVGIARYDQHRLAVCMLRRPPHAGSTMDAHSSARRTMRIQEGVQKSLCKTKTCTSSSPPTACATWARRSSTTTNTSGATATRSASIVFDDSSPANQEKYYPLLEQTRTHNDLYYVGPREKEQFLAYLNRRLRDKRLEGLVKNLFRPSYGGNRNFTLMYTLGGLMVSADDDMRPYALMEHSPESLGEDEVSRGRLHRAGQNGYTPQVVRHPRRRSSTCSASRPAEVPDNYERGEVLVDTAMDLETNATKGLARENSLMLRSAARCPTTRSSRWPRRSAPAPTTSTPSTSPSCSSTTRSRSTRTS